MSEAVPGFTIGTARRWSMLGLSMMAQMSGIVMVNGTAGLIPSLHQDEGMSLARAGFLAGMPILGMVLTQIAWGWPTGWICGSPCRCW